MSLTIKGRMLWHETNYCGQDMQGKVTKKTHQYRLPLALRRIPRLFLDFGDAKTRPHRKNRRIPFTETHFDKEKPHDIVWDLYFDKIQKDCDARFVLVPRGVFDWHQPIYHEAVGCLGWQYMGQLESSTFRWDLYLLLSDFFGDSGIPHCSIEAFLPSLMNAATQEPSKQPQAIAAGAYPPRRQTSKPTEIVCTDNGLLVEKTRASKRGCQARRKNKERKVGVLGDASNEIFVQ